MIVNGDDENLLSLLRKSGVFIDAPCAGNGSCGKCRIKIINPNPPADEEREKLSQKEIDSGIRLACRTRVNGSLEIELLAESGYEVKTDGAFKESELSPRVNFGVGAAIDIGTTTVACYFYDLTNGERLYTASGLNSQRVYGADVISRIKSASDMGGELLKSEICNLINGFFEDFCSACGKTNEDITDIHIVGNTVMLHLLCGLDASSIAVAPFTPKSLFGNDALASELSLNAAKDARVYLADSVASYVGGDITAGLLACDGDKWEKPCLYIDIGTNGEMALGDKNGFVCCATAAGPAFEGAHIKHGVGGIKGAISRVYLDGGIKTETIGQAEPIGICGSGLIDAVACLLEIGAVDETGRLSDEDLSLEYEGIFNEEDEAIISGEVTLTGKDIREIQLAKAAVAAGVKSLLNRRNISMEQVDRVIVAGGFGSFINIENAQKIGLLPKIEKGRTVAVGNAAGTGAVYSLLSKENTQRIKNITKNCEYFELSGDKYFENEYVEQMFFE